MTRFFGFTHKTLAAARRHRGKTLFLLLNSVLLLLYAWTLTESVPIEVQVADGRCLAVLSDRTAGIPCPGLSEGEIGLYLERVQDNNFAEVGPIGWFAPRAGWHDIRVSGDKPDERPFFVTFTDDLTYWRRVGDEWRPLLERSALRWRAPIQKTFTIQARVRRPEGELAGLTLLEPGGENGWIFLIDTGDRQASWWRWESGGPSEFILGVPFQKPLLAQLQSLLRVVLRGHHGALLLLLAGWLLNKFLEKRLFPAFNIASFQSRNFSRLLAILVLIVTVYIATDVLERIPHVQDSVTMLFQADLLAGGKVFAPPPAIPAFFEQEFLTVWNGRWFGQYTPGYPLVLVLGVLVNLPWLINPMLAALSMPLLYNLGLLLFGRKEALLAILLAIFSPFFIFMSGSMMVHPSELFWTILFLVGWVYWLKKDRRRRWLVGAGAALGMVLLTRQITAVTVGGSVIGLTIIASLSGKFGWENSKPDLSKVLGGGLVTVVSTLPFFFLLLGYQWAVTGDPFQDPRLISRPFDRPGFGQDIGSADNAFIVQEVEGVRATTWYTDPDLPPRGHTLARGLFNTIQNWNALNDHLFGWLPFLTLSYIWLVFVAGRPVFGDWLLLGLGTAVTGVYITYWSSGIMYGPRYYYAALPTFLLLTARGIVALGKRLNGRSGWWIAIGITALFIFGNLLFYLPESLAESRGFNFVSGEPLKTVEESIEGPAILFISGNKESWWEYGQFFSGNTPWLDGQIIYARDLGEENGRLLEAYPDRTAYCWNSEKDELTAFPCHSGS